MRPPACVARPPGAKSGGHRWCAAGVVVGDGEAVAAFVVALGTTVLAGAVVAVGLAAVAVVPGFAVYVFGAGRAGMVVAVGFAVGAPSGDR